MCTSMKENEQSSSQNNTGNESNKPQGYGTTSTQYSEADNQKPAGYGTVTISDSEK